MNREIGNLKSVIELTELGSDFEAISIPKNVHTVDDVLTVCRCEKPEVIKTLLFIGVAPIVALVTGDKKVDIQKLKVIKGDSSLRIANREEVLEITGCAVGTVSPFGIGKIEVVADQAIKELDNLIMGSGKGDFLLKMRGHDFSKAFRGTFFTIAA